MGIIEDRIAKHRETIEKIQKGKKKAEELKAKGFSNAAIAKELGISENTIRRVLGDRK